MRFPKKVDLLIIVFFVFLLASGVSIYLFNAPRNPSFSIKNVNFELGTESRFIEFDVEVDKGNIELKEVFVNDEKVINWEIDSVILKEKESSPVSLDYNWNTNRDYLIKVITIDDQLTLSKVKSPSINPKLNFTLLNTSLTKNGDYVINADYEANGTGIGNFQGLIFTYLSFQESTRPIYMFYDEKFMDEDTMNRAEAITRYFKGFNKIIRKTNFAQIAEISETQPKIILILINPLRDKEGRSLENAVPAPLIDQNEDGFTKDDSKYNKTVLYDWMKENGLVLITVGSLQPHKKILYANGSYTTTKESQRMFDAHYFLTDAHGEESIIKGSFRLGEYTPVRISSSLGLSFREESFGFDKNAMEKYGLEYYAYGDYSLDYSGTRLNLTLPVFIRVGLGGWLAMGNDENWLSNEELAHDLFLIYLQEIWNSEWIPFGWYWDSGTKFHPSFGMLNVTGSLETEQIPSSLLDEKIVSRILGIAYSLEEDGGTVTKEKSVNLIN